MQTEPTARVDHPPTPATITLAGVGRGMHANLAAIPAVIVFGIGFGAAATEAGLLPGHIIAMSALVFAGAAQYAALDLWHHPLPLLPLLMVTLALNARHLVLGATLHAYLRPAKTWLQNVTLALLSDANWAATKAAEERGERDLGHLVGGGLTLWLTWFLGTAIGVGFGHVLGDLTSAGIDVVMPAFFGCALVGMTTGKSDLPPLVVSGGVAALLATVTAPHWAVLAGILSGGVAGAVYDSRA